MRSFSMVGLIALLLVGCTTRFSYRDSENVTTGLFDNDYQKMTSACYEVELRVTTKADLEKIGFVFPDKSTPPFSVLRGREAMEKMFGKELFEPGAWYSDNKATKKEVERLSLVIFPHKYLVRTLAVDLWSVEEKISGNDATFYFMFQDDVVVFTNHAKRNVLETRITPRLARN